jgi:hypothetical protein
LFTSNFRDTCTRPGVN